MGYDGLQSNELCEEQDCGQQGKTHIINTKIPLHCNRGIFGHIRSTEEIDAGSFLDKKGLCRGAI